MLHVIDTQSPVEEFLNRDQFNNFLLSHMTEDIKVLIYPAVGCRLSYLSDHHVKIHFIQAY